MAGSAAGATTMVGCAAAGAEDDHQYCAPKSSAPSATKCSALRIARSRNAETTRAGAPQAGMRRAMRPHRDGDLHHVIDALRRGQVEGVRAQHHRRIAAIEVLD